jgi:proton-dependent oligopeptide transporter, POT family
MAIASESLDVKGKSFAGHPIGLSTLFFTEMWERFSYYGIRPLLVLFMSAAIMDGGFGFEREQASAIVGIYAACVYLASLPGGWIADRLLGLQKAILYGAICISAGHISIGISAFLGGKVTFFLGLVLIVIGTGLLKPNISAIVGDLYPEGGSRRDAGFSIFYMGINLGALLGQTITGFLGEKIGWHWGFGAAGVAMLLGLFVFATRRKSTLGSIGVEPTKHPDPQVQARTEKIIKISIAVFIVLLALVFILASTGTITINAKAVAQSMTYILVGVVVLYFLYIFTLGSIETPLTVDEKKRILVIAILFMAAAVFWSAFEQAPTSLNLFAKDFTQREVFGFEIPATWFQSINPLLIILLAPVFAYIWTWLGQRNMDLSSPAKFALGLFFAAIGFLFMIFAANEVLTSNGQLKVSMFWLVASYFFQTVGELCLSPVGLSSMTKLSPRRFVGQMMGIWFLAAAVGNLIGGLVGGRVDPEKLDQMPTLFTYTTLSLLIATVVLAALIIPIRRMMKDIDV